MKFEYGGNQMDFNTEAINWDSERRIKRGRVISEEIMNSIDIKDDYSALEFGCGTGIISFNMKDKFRHITLVDTSEGMIEKLSSKIREFKVDNMTAIKADINKDELLKGQKFDVIYTSMVLHHILDIRTTLNNLYELLDDHGYLCIIELAEDDGSFHRSEKDFNGYNGFNQEWLKGLLEEIGYKSVKTNTFYNSVKIIEGVEVNYSLFIMVGRK